MILQKNQLMPVDATVGTADYADTTSVKYIIHAATQSSKLGLGSIILMHEKQKTMDALPPIIAYYKREGYRFVTVLELLDNENLKL